LPFAWDERHKCLMKNSQKELLQFPAPLEQPENSTITVHVGGDHFALHYQIEDLPPLAPELPSQQIKKRAPPSWSFRTCHPAPAETRRSGRAELAGNNMLIETQYLRLPTPVTLSSRFNDWRAHRSITTGVQVSQDRLRRMPAQRMLIENVQLNY
jgi:hypothetical protein